MKRREAVLRYYLILEKLGRGTYPTLRQLSAHLESEGCEASTRTLQRDFVALSSLFDLDVVYDREREGYRLLECGRKTEDALRFLEAAAEASVLIESFDDVQRTLAEISFGMGGGLKGIGHLRSLLLAVRLHRVVEFDHEKFEDEGGRHYRVRPWSLREYLGRWYLYGEVASVPNPLFFGLDRITNLEVTEDRFPAPSSPAAMENLIGISGAGEKPSLVTLEFTALQGKYVKALPLHPSQKVIEDSPRQTVVTIRVVINHELRQLILMQGSSVRVRSPESLAADIKAEHKKSAGLY